MGSGTGVFITGWAVHQRQTDIWQAPHRHRTPFPHPRPSRSIQRGEPRQTSTKSFVFHKQWYSKDPYGLDDPQGRPGYQDRIDREQVDRESTSDEGDAGEALNSPDRSRANNRFFLDDEDEEEPRLADKSDDRHAVEGEDE